MRSFAVVILFSRASCRVPGRAGSRGHASVPGEEEDVVTRVTYHYVTSLEFRIRRAHLDADTPANAVKEPELYGKREKERERKKETWRRRWRRRWGGRREGSKSRNRW